MTYINKEKYSHLQKDLKPENPFVEMDGSAVSFQNLATRRSCPWFCKRKVPDI